MSACIKEMEMEREVDRISAVMEGKQIKSMSEVKAIEITVPAPGGVRIGIMSGAGTDPDPVFGTGTNLMAIRERVGMDAGCFLASNFPHFHRYDSLKSALYIHAISKNINTFPKNQGRIRAAIAVEILDFTVMYR